MQTIFERIHTRVDSVDGRGDLFLRLEAENQSPLAMVKPINATIFEGFSFASPVITVTFVDGIGIYFNVEKIKISETFYLSIGKSQQDSNQIPVKIANIALDSSQMGTTAQISYKITFVHQNWNELINKRRNRGWSNVRYSDIVSEIASECGFSDIDVETSRNVHPSIIQPYWDNVSFLRFIQRHAVSNKFDDHFEFGCDINNRFFFKTVSAMIEEQKPKTMSNQTRTFVLESRNTPSLEDSSETFFAAFKSNEFYMDSVLSGAGGVNAMHYDWNKGQFISKNVTLSDSNALMLSDNYSIHTSNEVSNKRVFCGRVDGFAESTGVVSSVALSNNQFTITIEGDRTLNIGQVVELIIKPDNEFIKEPVSELYSGFYVIASINHIVALDETNKHITVIDVARQGYDSKEIDGYAVSKLGKFTNV
jgi:hypothetical protein